MSEERKSDDDDDSKQTQTLEFQIKLDDYDSNQTQTLEIEIPYHLIIDNILPRLPVKTLIRFKCVSKDWLHTISSNYFAKSHLKLSSSSPSNQSVIMLRNSTKPPLYSVLLVKYDEYNDEKQLQLVEVGSDFKDVFIMIVGCCNGLVCLYLGIPNGMFRIWNPATHSYRDVLLPEVPRKCKGVGVGFGYASSIDDYKIMYFRSITYDNVQLYLFSLRTGEWRCVSSASGVRVCFGINRMVWARDSLCWLLRNNLDRIFSFDLVAEQWTEIPIPLRNGCYDDVHLCVINGNFALLGIQYMKGKGPQVWMLAKADSGVSNSWQKLLSLDKDMSLVGVFDNGNFLVQYDEKTKCFSMNWKANKLNVIDPTQDVVTQLSHSTIDFPYCAVIENTFNYVESLISPFGMANPH